MSKPVTTGREVRQDFGRSVRRSASRFGARLMLAGTAAAALLTAAATLPLPGGEGIAAERLSPASGAVSRLDMRRQLRGAAQLTGTAVPEANAAAAFGGGLRLTANDGTAGSLFGGAVAISGTTAVVGANAAASSGTGIGAVYVYTLTSQGWTLQQKLTASDGERDDSFGASVAISGDTIVVGSFGDTVGNNVNQGSAYVFTRTGTAWTQQQKLTAGDGAATDVFGRSVAIEGDTVVVGSVSANIGTNVDQGAAYVFTRSGTTWTQQQKLVASDGATSDALGDSVAISGNSVVVSATDDTVGTNGAQGSAYVFTRSGTTWTQQAKLVATDGRAFDYFGFSTSISGDTVAVGTLGDVGANFQQGSVYIFVRSGTTWTQQQKLVATDGAANDSFGNSVYLVGDTVMIGAAFDTNGANARQGSAYFFTRSGSNWTQTQKLTAGDGGANDEFGTGVAFTANHAIVGSAKDTVGSNAEQGSAYLFSQAVTVSGRVTSPTGQNLRNIVVTMTDAAGVRRYATTSSFGIFTFDNVSTGQVYNFTISAKRYRFGPRQITVDSAVSNLDFVGQE